MLTSQKCLVMLEESWKSIWKRPTCLSTYRSTNDSLLKVPSLIYSPCCERSQPSEHLREGHNRSRPPKQPQHGIPRTHEMWTRYWIFTNTSLSAIQSIHAVPSRGVCVVSSSETTSDKRMQRTLPKLHMITFRKMNLVAGVACCMSTVGTTCGFPCDPAKVLQVRLGPRVKHTMPDRQRTTQGRLGGPFPDTAPAIMCSATRLQPIFCAAFKHQGNGSK